MRESIYLPSPPTWKRRLLRWAARTLGLVLVVTAVAATRLEILKGRAEARLAAAQAKLDADDPGWRYDDIYAARPRPPADLDAIRVLRSVGDLPAKDAPAKPHRSALAPNQPLPPEQLAKARADLIAHAGRLAVAEKAGRLVEGNYEITLAKNPIETKILEAANAKNFADLLALKGEDCWDRRDPAGMAEVVRGQLNLANALRGGTMLITALVRVAIDAQAVAGLERMLGRLPDPEPAVLAGLQARLLALAAENRLRDGLRGERVTLAKSFDYLNDGNAVGDLRGDGLFDGVAAWAYSRHFLDDHVLYLEVMTEAVALASRPPWERVEAARQFHDDADARVRAASEQGRGKLTALFLPAVTKMTTATNSHLARVTSAAVALACERYRLDHRRWPADLAALVPRYLDRVPPNPWTGAAPVLTFSDGGLIVRCDPREALPPSIPSRFALVAPERR